MPVAIFFTALMGAVAGFLTSLAFGAGVLAAIAVTPVAGSLCAILLCMLVVTRPGDNKPTAVRGSNSEPECIPAP